MAFGFKNPFKKKKQLGTLFLKPGEVFIKEGINVEYPTGTAESQVPTGNIEEVLRRSSGDGGSRRQIDVTTQRRLARESAAASARVAAAEAARVAAEEQRMQQELAKKQAQRQQQQQVVVQAGRTSTITTMDTPRGKDTVVIKDATGRFVRDASERERKYFNVGRTKQIKTGTALRKTEEFGREISTRQQQFQQGQKAGADVLFGGGQVQQQVRKQSIQQQPEQKDITQIFGGKGINLQPAFDRAGKRIDRGITGTASFVVNDLFKAPGTLKETTEYTLKAQKEKGYVKGTIAGGWAGSKFIVLRPFGIVQNILREVETGISSKGGTPAVWTGAAVGTVADFVPTSYGDLGAYYVGGKAFKYAPGLTKTALTGLGAYEFTQAETPKEYLTAGVLVGAGAGGTVVKYSRVAKSLVLPGGAKKIPFVDIKGTPLRQRATVVLKNEKGKILYQVDKPTGTYMLPGGAIDKGEIPIQAAKRELFEETGLKNLKLKFKEIIKTSEQKHYVYEGTLKKSDINILKPQAKEVTGFKWIKPPKYTGASALQPFGRKSSYLNPFEKKIVRAEDLYVGSKSLYPEIKQTSLVIQKPGEIFLRREQVTYLKKRVGKYSVSRLWGKKPGQFLKFQETPGIEVGFGSRYNIPFKKLKQYGGKELWYTHGSRGRIQTDLEVASKIKPKGFKDIDVKEIFKVLKGKGKRGENVLYFQPPTISDPLASQSYLGATYLGLYRKAKPSYEMGVSLKKGSSPQIYRLKAVAGKDLIYTKRAIKGSEFEVGATPGTVFSVEKSLPSTYLGGRKIKVSKIKIGKVGEGKLSQTEINSMLKNINKLSPAEQKGFLSKVKKETGIEYAGSFRPVSVGEVITDVSSSKLIPSKPTYKPTTYKTPTYETTIYKPTTYKPTTYKTPTTYYEKSLPVPSPPTTYKTPPTYYEETPIVPPPTPPPTTYKTPPPTYKTPPYKQPSIIPKFKQPKFKKPRTKKFLVEVRRGGIFKPVGFAETKGGALKIGEDIVSKTLARTFKITGTGIKKVTGFRTKKEKGGLVFIEPSRRALGTRTEVQEIFGFKRKAPKKKKKPLFYKKKGEKGYGFV